jgi:hypothetical protein
MVPPPDIGAAQAAEDNPSVAKLMPIASKDLNFIEVSPKVVELFIYFRELGLRYSLTQLLVQKVGYLTSNDEAVD